MTRLCLNARCISSHVPDVEAGRSALVQPYNSPPYAIISHHISYLFPLLAAHLTGFSSLHFLCRCIRQFLVLLSLQSEGQMHRVSEDDVGSPLPHGSCLGQLGIWPLNSAEPSGFLSFTAELRKTSRTYDKRVASDRRRILVSLYEL
jgi:hypothetical protein